MTKKGTKKPTETVLEGIQRNLSSSLLVQKVNVLFSSYKYSSLVFAVENKDKTIMGTIQFNITQTVYASETFVVLRSGNRQEHRAFSVDICSINDPFYVCEPQWNLVFLWIIEKSVELFPFSFRCPLSSILGFSLD